MRKKHLLAIAIGALLVTGIAGGVALASADNEGDIDAATLARAKISLTQAIATAEQETGGRAVSADLRAENGMPRIEVETAGPQGPRTVVVDAQSGHVAATRAGEENDHQDQD